MDVLYRAQKLYFEKQPALARPVIDSAFVHPETGKMPETHTIRAYIYFELYKVSEKNMVKSPLRDTILFSLYRSEALKPDSSYHSNNIKLLNNIAVGYYNLCNSIFNEQKNDNLSEEMYQRYKEIMRKINPSFDEKSKDIEYYNMLGSHFTSRYIDQVHLQNKENKDDFEKSKIYLMKVIELDPDNEQANLNFGLLHYTAAVFLIKSLDAATDLSQLDSIQENAGKLAKKAEVFVLKTYQKNSSNKLAVEALYYIYRALYDKEKYMEFAQKCNQMGIQINK